MTRDIKKLEQELDSVNSHLALLRGEFVKCQKRNLELEAQVNASGATANAHSLPASLAVQAHQLLNQDALSDIDIALSNGVRQRGHKFLLAARSKHWNAAQLNKEDCLDLSAYSEEASRAMIKWLYTDAAPAMKEDAMIELMHMAKAFDLVDLSRRSEEALKPMITRSNCVKFYQLAEEIESKELIDYTGNIVSENWDQLGPEELESVKAPLLFEMLKRKSQHPLHRAIKALREDVVFLYLIEFNADLAVRLNAPDENGAYPLDIAMAVKNESLGKILVSHGANINRKSDQGVALIQSAIERDDYWTAQFLFDASARLDLVNTQNENILHTLASKPKLGAFEQLAPKIALVTNINGQDDQGQTPVHQCIASSNIDLMRLIIEHRPNLTLQNEQGQTALRMALESHNEKASITLLESGADPTAPSTSTGDSIMHILVRNDMVPAAELLLDNGQPDLEHCNHAGEALIHTIVIQQNRQLLEKVIEKGIDINTVMPDQETIKGGSALHISLANQSFDCAELLIATLNKQGVKTIVGDDEHHSALGLALQHNKHTLAESILELGGNIDQVVNGDTLLIGAIEQKSEASCLFLLNNRANANMTVQPGRTPLTLAVVNNLDKVVEILCVRGADKEAPDQDGNVALWLSLKHELFHIAETLVAQGADVDNWSSTGRTLLHRCLKERNELGAVFLITNGANIHEAPRSSDNTDLTINDEDDDDTPKSLDQILAEAGRDAHDEGNPFGDDDDGDDEGNPFGGSEADEEEGNPFGDGTESEKPNQNNAQNSYKPITTKPQVPLHHVAEHGFLLVINALLDANVDLNYANEDGNTALHIAIIFEHKEIIEMLINHNSINLRLQNNDGLTPFSTALRVKNTKAAEQILEKEPTTAEQFDKSGLNFLHTAINAKDIEAVLFLVQVRVDVNSRTRDGDDSTPLHLAVKTGDEFIIRNLTLAGGEINATDRNQSTPLHLATELDLGKIIEILLQCGAEAKLADESGNNCLHLAARWNAATVTPILLAQSNIDPKLPNAKGKNFLHLLAFHGGDNVVEQFNMLMEHDPSYPINETDLDGNTAMFLAYSNGDTGLCVALARLGSVLAVPNSEGLTIFNLEVSTQRLKYRILDQIQVEPPWAETEKCQITDEKFSMRLRKHHCRHCGRCVAEKVSKNRLVIAKFGGNKPVRVCDLCHEVLTQRTVTSGYSIQ